MPSTGTKLKIASLLQTLATAGAGMGAHVPSLAKWGEGNQQLIANYARALEMEKAKKEAEKRKKGGFFGKLLGTVGLIGGGIISPVAGALLGGIGNIAGQAIGGGKVYDYTQPFDMMVQGYTTGYGAKTFAKSENRGVNIGDVLKAYTGVTGNQMYNWQPYYITKMNGMPIVLSADPMTMYLLNMMSNRSNENINEDEFTKKYGLAR